MCLLSICTDEIKLLRTAPAEGSDKEDSLKKAPRDTASPQGGAVQSITFIPAKRVQLFWVLDRGHHLWNDIKNPPGKSGQWT